MSDAGYTLSETLAAMVVIGLAISGLTFAVQVLGTGQARTSALVGQVRDLRSAQQTLEGWLARGAPFRPRDARKLVGTATELQFDCGAASRCGAAIKSMGQRVALHLSRSGVESIVALPDVGRPAFRYRADARTTATWPASSDTPAHLKAVSIIDEAATGGRVLLEARVWQEQPGACAFDPILQDCR